MGFRSKEERIAARAPKSAIDESIARISTNQPWTMVWPFRGEVMIGRDRGVATTDLSNQCHDGWGRTHYVVFTLFPMRHCQGLECMLVCGYTGPMQRDKGGHHRSCLGFLSMSNACLHLHKAIQTDLQAVHQWQFRSVGGIGGSSVAAETAISALKSFKRLR